MQVERGLTPRLATRILVNGPEWPADFLRIVWMECTGVPGALGVPANMCAMRGGCSDSEAMADVGGGEGRRERSMSKDDSDALSTRATMRRRDAGYYSDATADEHKTLHDE